MGLQLEACRLNFNADVWKLARLLYQEAVEINEERDAFDLKSYIENNYPPGLRCNVVLA